MFLDRLLDLISEAGITKNKLLTDLGLSKNSIVDWTKRGTIPKGDTLQAIADYFDVSTDYLLGKSNVRKPSVEVYDEHDHRVVLDDEALELIDSLRSRPEMKILFSVSKKASKEDILQAVKIIEALKGDDE